MGQGADLCLAASNHQDAYEVTMFCPKQKRLLALDGGGIMGVASLQILKALEDQLRSLSLRPADFRLRDFFDYIGGTSTGAIIAAGLSLGWSAQELIDFYETSGPRMFRRAYPWRRAFHKFSGGPLTALLREKIGEDSILDLQREQKLQLNKHLLIVTHNISTNSPWPISTNPRAKFNAEDQLECNRRIPLWQLVRASTAAPTYFPPQEIILKNGARKFEDGGVTPYNNPAFLLYRMATLPQYRCEWPDGESKMMLISVGTGCVALSEPNVGTWGRNLYASAAGIPGGLMQRISAENDILCRTIGRCVFGAEIDSEIGDLTVPSHSHEGDLGRRFVYARYDPDLTDGGLRNMGLDHLTGRRFAIDAVSQMPALKVIGEEYAQSVDIFRDFPRFARLHSDAELPSDSAQGESPLTIPLLPTPPEAPSYSEQ
jgi:uncharacterized protein